MASKLDLLVSIPLLLAINFLKENSYTDACSLFLVKMSIPYFSLNFSMQAVYLDLCVLFAW